MKKEILLLLVFVMFQKLNLVGQGSLNYMVQVSDMSTTHLKFAHDVTYVDVGNTDVMVDYFDNIVKLKAKKRNFPVTSITVITESNKLFSADLFYKSKLDDYVISIKDEQLHSKFSEDKVSENEVSSVKKDSNISSTNMLTGDENMRSISDETLDYVMNAFDENYSFYRIGTFQQGVFLSLRNIFVYDDYMIIRTSVENKSNISYTVDLENIFVKDGKGLERTARQDISVPIIRRFIAELDNEKPINEYNDTNFTVGPKSKVEVVYVLDKFNSSRGKSISVELSELGSERRLDLIIPIKYIKRAKLL